MMDELPTEASDSDAIAVQALTFEAAYERLEKTVGRLEATDLALEEALALYEEGLTLVHRCNALLEAAELKIQQVRPSDASPGETATLTS